MGKGPARSIYEYDSVADFIADGGAEAYGSGFGLVSGAGFWSSKEGASLITPVQLLPAKTEKDYATAKINTKILQEFIDEFSCVSVVAKNSSLSIYPICDGDDPQAIITIPSHRELYLGNGVVIDNLGHSSGLKLSKSAFINSNGTSEFVSITGLTYNQDPITNWFSICELNVGSAKNFFVGDYVYIRPAYSGGDTTRFLNWIYRVESVDNTDPDNKKFTVYVALGSDSSWPSITGNLIAYPANSSIKIHGPGFIRQSTQNRGGGSATVFSRSSFMQVVMNKCADSYIDVRLIGSPGSVSVGNANCFNQRVVDSYGYSATGVMCFGNNYGTSIEGVSGASKDDLIALFAAGTGYPFFDKNGTQANSIGPIIGTVIDYKGKVHTNAESNGVSIISEGGELIDGIRIKNYTGRNMRGQFLHISNGYGAVGGNANIGTISVENIHYEPRKGGKFGLINSIDGGTLTIKKLSFDKCNINAGSVDGNTGFQNINGRFLSFQSAASGVIDELHVTNSRISVDCGIGAQTDVDLVFLDQNYLIKKILVKNNEIGDKSANTKGARFVNSTATSASFGIERYISEHNTYALPYKGALRCAPTGKPVAATFKGDVIENTSTNAFIDTDLPSGSSVTVEDCDYSKAQFGAIFTNGSAVATYNFTFGGNYGGTKRLIHPDAGSNKIYNVRSKGGNRVGDQVLGGAGNTWNFYGSCADIRCDITGAARVDGAIIYNTNNAAGTLGVAGLVVGQGVAANSYKLLSDPTKSY